MIKGTLAGLNILLSIFSACLRIMYNNLASHVFTEYYIKYPVSNILQVSVYRNNILLFLDERNYRKTRSIFSKKSLRNKYKHNTLHNNHSYSIFATL